MLILLLMVIVGLGGIVLSNVVGGVSLESLPQLPIAVAVAGVLCALYLASHYETRRLGSMKAIPILGLAALALATLAYFYRNVPASISDILASLPGPTADQRLAPDAPASVRIRRNADGGFRSHAQVNGSDVTMLVDTGSSAVVLRGSDAEKAGIETKDLVYETPLATANGTTYVGAARLKTLRVGDVTARDVEALVAKPGTLNESLLGMTFLRRLASYEVAGDFVTLRQ